jgi:pilus assembly protein Flp/PilA
MKNVMKRLWKEEEGQDLIEYVLLIALIALASASVFPNVAGAINGVFTKASNCLAAGTAAGC